ncbi:pentatricopeptide repeat-containing protein At5g04780, mitochondrial-like [Papaver somniferum]|uniref:pentatricopeptide repeat-containing protein At5g04780, mitochondrial-like n=1 Tax=Papaver somniferum TaxID=3469 RepID=UPI000E6F7214|nr:pentatricopeptide repeat-containing protein At5g04780, mitochondrial-like [Papaver somniferum]
MGVVRLSSIMRNCLPLSAINQIKQTHTQILINGFYQNLTLQTDLILVYSRCSDHLKYAQQVFDRMTDRNMHSWNILISSYVQNSLYHDSLRMFDEFLKTGLRPDHFTFPSIFKACAGIGDSCIGKVMHSWIIKLGFEDHVVVRSSLIDFYAKCENLIDANRLFGKMVVRDVVVWNSMIGGFARAGFSEEALFCFKEMQEEGLKMDLRTIPSILSACGKEDDLMKGKEIHGQVVKSLRFSRDIAIGNAIIDMYAKCGCLSNSRLVFKNMNDLSVVTWTTLISSYGVNGKGEESIILFEEMIAAGFKPNCVTFTAILSSCSHSGLIHQGRRIFNSMSSDFGIKPGIEHYACMVDLLGRFGHLEEALELVKNFPGEAAASVWGALLGACRIHKNMEIGEIAAYQLFELEAHNSSNYIALSNIYESVGRWDNVQKLRARMKELALVKTPGLSWININDRVFRFFQGDVSLPQMKMAYETLDTMSKIMMLPQGYE